MKSFSLPLVSGVLCLVLGIMGSFMPTFWGALEYAALATGMLSIFIYAMLRMVPGINRGTILKTMLGCGVLYFIVILFLSVQINKKKFEQQKSPAVTAGIYFLKNFTSPSESSLILASS